jgi:hypothetical protein
MENHSSNAYPYFGEELMMQQFALLAESIQKALPPENEGQRAIAQQLANINSKQEKWPQRILQVYRDRNLPVFTIEAVTKLNQAHTAFVDDVNDTRRRQKESLKSDMGRKKKQLDDLQSKRDKCIDSYESVVMSCQREQNLHPPHSFERVRLGSQIDAAQDAYASSMRRLQQSENVLRQELTVIERNYIPIRVLSNQSNQKNLICPKNNSSLGWIPHLDSYQLIQNVKPPPKEEIFRHISFEPESQLTNLPLSIFNIIQFADQIGATDQTLLTMLIIYLRQYKPVVLETLDTKKKSLNAVIETLSFHCTTTNEKAVVLHRLRSFQRAKHETFAASISRFDGLHVFFLQLDQPSEADQIRHLSYQTLRQVTPYLISPKCGSAFGQWVVESVKLQTEITKESIIRIVTSLESHDDLRLTSSRQLPGFLITTTLNLPPGESEITLQANAALGNNSPPKLFPPPLTKPPTRPSSSSNSSSSGRPSSAGKSPTFQQRSKSRDKSKSPGRQSSKSPNRNNRDDRGRSPSVKPQASTSRSASRSNSTAAYIAEIDTLQYYSIHNKSPVTVRKQSMPSMFRRPLTPKTYSQLKGNYFFKTNPDRFKDVMKDSRCLRCWSKQHRASACTVYTKPTPGPCRYCHYLYHKTEDCRFYDENGKSRNPSRSKSPA